MKTFRENTVESTFAIPALTHLSLRHFRNYGEALFDLSPGHNLFIGLNGMGKSNILEALHALSTTRSFRGAKEQEMIQIGAEGAKIGAALAGTDTEIEIQYSRSARGAGFIAGQKLPRVRDIVGRFPTVCFSSTDLAIIRGEPSERRRFLDSELSLSSPSYLKAFSAYRRALEQRNAALRAVREGASHIGAVEPWENRLAEAGSVLRQQRSAYVSQLSALARDYHRHVSDCGEELSLEYRPQDLAMTPQELLPGFAARRQLDVIAGSTSYGPHRDDVEITIEGISAKSYGSQGQQRTAVVAIKLGVVGYWRERLRTLPALLLDDIMSDLDERRRGFVLEASASLGQVVVTATDISQLSAEVLSNAKVFSVHEGQVSEI